MGLGGIGITVVKFGNAMLSKQRTKLFEAARFLRNGYRQYRFTTLTDLGTLTLPPVESGGVVYRVDAQDGSGEYFLLENRQSDVGASYDLGLYEEGLLVWQIDQGIVDATWSSSERPLTGPSMEVSALMVVPGVSGW